MNQNDKLEKHIESLIDQMLKAEPIKHLFPGHNVMDDLQGPAKVLEDDKPDMSTGGKKPPTSPDYDEQPSEMHDEQGRALGEEPNQREQKSPTSPDYGLQPSDKLKRDGRPMKLDGRDHSPTSPDLGLQPEKTYEEKAGDRGRPMEVHDVPNIDDERPSGKGYEAVQHETARISKEYHAADPTMNREWEEVERAQNQIKKSGYVVSEEDYQFLMDAKRQKQQNEIRKSQSAQSDMIKSIVDRSVSALREENTELKKAVLETRELLKSLGRRPQERKSIANVAALEKSFANTGDDEGPKPFSKTELMDAAEELVKSGKLPVEAVIELEREGTVRHQGARRAIEEQLRKSHK